MPNVIEELDKLINTLATEKTVIEATIGNLIILRGEAAALSQNHQEAIPGPKKKYKIRYEGISNKIRTTLSDSEMTSSQIRVVLTNAHFLDAEPKHLKMRVSTELARLFKQGELNKRYDKGNRLVHYSLKKK